MWKPTPNPPRARSLSNDTESRRRLIPPGEGGLFPFAPPQHRRHRLGSDRFLPPRRKQARMTFPDEFPRAAFARALFPPFQRDFRSSRGRGQVDSEVSASNKNLGQIGRIVQFYLPRCPPRNVCVKTFTFSSLRRFVSRLAWRRVMHLAANCSAN